MADQTGIVLKVPPGPYDGSAAPENEPPDQPTAPEPDKLFARKPMPKYQMNHRALQLATQHRISSATKRRPRTAGAGGVSTRTVAHRRCRSRLSAHSGDGMEADTAKSQTTESDWLDFLEQDDYDYDAEDEPVYQGPTAAALEKETHCQRIYRAACRAARIAPATTVLRGLIEKEISLKHHIIGPAGARALALGLCECGMVEKLDLQDNGLGPLGTSHICDMVRENEFITELSLKDNKLGSEGAKLICKLLKENDNITKLNLSGNDFQEYDADVFLEMLQANYTLKELDLSHNDFRLRGGEILAKALAENTYLEVLDLSWNHLRSKGAAAIGKALTHNIGLKTLNLSWNGLHLDGCKALGKALAVNHSLLRLDLSCNRIDKECLNHLLLGMLKNTRLTYLSLNQNPIGNEGAMSVLECIERAQDPAIEEIDLSSVSVDIEFKRKKRAMAAAGRALFILHGHLVRQDEVANMDVEEIFLNDDPMMVLMEFARLKNFRLVDLFSSMDKDGSGTLTIDEFRIGLLKANVPLSALALNRLMKKLDDNKDGEVDFVELSQGQKEHKRKVNKMKKLATERGLKFEETEIGRVSLKLHALLSMTFRRAIRPLTSVQTAIRTLKDGTARPARPRTVGPSSVHNISSGDLPSLDSPLGSLSNLSSPVSSRPQSGISNGRSVTSAGRTPKATPIGGGSGPSGPSGRLAWGLLAGKTPVKT